MANSNRDPRSDAEKAIADLKRNAEMDISLTESPLERQPSVTSDIGDHKSRIEADPELTDELRTLNSLCGLHSVHESLSARACDGAEALDHLLPVHPDAVIFDGQAAVLAIGDQGDPGFRVIAEEGRGRDPFEPQPLASIRRIGDQPT